MPEANHPAALPAEARRPAIVIFGAAVRPGGQPSNTLRLRVEAALGLGRRLRRPLYLPSGGLGLHPPAEAAVMAALLRQAGVAAADILIDDTAPDTLASVRNTAALLRARGHRGPVYAATSAYHLPRCVLLLRLAGLAARPCPPPRVPAATSPLKRWRWRLREVAAVPWDVLMLAVGGR